MLNFREWADDAQLFVLAVLFAMPWCSAEDLARLRPYSRAYMGKLLLRVEAQGLVYREKAGHVAGQVWRWALEEKGVAEVCRRCGVRPHWSSSRQGLRYLLWRMDTVEPTYRIVPALFQHCGEQVEVFPSVVSAPGTLSPLDAYMPPVPSNSWLVGFRWCLAPRFDAVAEYVGPDGKGIQITVARCGLHGREPMAMAPDASFRGLAGGEDDWTLTAGFQGLNYEPGAYHSSYHNVTTYVMRTASTVTISNENDECSMQLALSNYVGLSPIDWRATLSADDAGKWLAPLFLESSFGRLKEPAERGTVTVPDIANGAGNDADHGAIQERPSHDPIFRAVNGAMGAKVFRKVSSHAVIHYRDIVKDCAPTDRAGVRKCVNEMEAVGLFASFNDTYRLDGNGIELVAIRDGVAPETVIARFAGMLDRNGNVRKRWLRRKAIIGHLATELRGEDIPTVEGWYPALEVSGIQDRRVDPDGPCPDAWVLLQRWGWFALEYLESKFGTGMIETILRRYSDGSLSRVKGLLAVCETPAVEDLVRRSDPGLGMLTTTMREAVTGPHYGHATVWRHQGCPKDIHSLLDVRFRINPL